MFKRLMAIAVLGTTLAVPSVASADTCSTPLRGTAFISATGSEVATGAAFVRYGGRTDIVTFDSRLSGPDTVDQTWYFDEGAVDIVETRNGRVRGDWERINSVVEVQAPDSGTWRYRGLFNRVRLEGVFRVTGTICFAP